MPEQLELVAHGVTAILATWLGLIVLTRSAHRPGARLFGLLTLYLVAWSVAIVVQRLTTQPEGIIGPLNAVEDVAAYLLPVTSAIGLLQDIMLRGVASQAWRFAVLGLIAAVTLFVAWRGLRRGMTSV